MFVGLGGRRDRFRMVRATQGCSRSAVSPPCETRMMLARAGMPRCSTSALRAMAMEDTQHSMRAVILRISSDAKSDMTRRVKDQITWGGGGRKRQGEARSPHGGPPHKHGTCRWTKEKEDHTNNIGTKDKGDEAHSASKKLP